jgi:hypothetical protein
MRIILVGFGCSGQRRNKHPCRRYLEKTKDYGFNPKIVAIADIDGAVINPKA